MREKWDRIKDVVFLSLGVLCLLYYVACASVIGMFSAQIWIWFLMGILFLVRGMIEWYIKKKQITVKIPIIVRSIYTAGLVLSLALFLFVEVMIISHMTNQGEKDLDYIIVLGAAVRGDVPSLALSYRINKAYTYLKDNPDTQVIVSGGKGSGENVSEAECMARILEEKGIEASRILMEDKSTSTEENLEFSYPLIENDNTNIGIVSSNFHLYRALRIANKYGYSNVQGISAAYPVYLLPHSLVREFIGIILLYLH